MTLAFDIAYQGTPTWDIGRPQGVVVRLARAGAITGDVIDVGCGTGEHAWYLAGLGHGVLGIDIAGRAIERARAKARRVDRPPAFVVGDALALGTLPDRFDTALDVGLFHVLQPGERRGYARSLASVVRPGGSAFVVCWSDRNPFGYGPERITRRVLRGTFVAAEGWTVVGIEPETLETRMEAGAVQAWLARLRRRG